MTDLRFWPAGTFLSHAFESPPFLIPPLLPSKGIILLHGKREAGKTQLALTLALAVTGGTNFLNYQSRPGKALLLQVDMVPEITQERLRKNPEFDAINLITSPNSINVLELAGQRADKMPRAIREAQTLMPDLIIVDSLRKIYGDDENSSNFPVKVYGACRELFPTGAFVFIHHDRKDNEFGDPASDEAFRGSGAWLDEPDTGLHLVRKKASREVEKDEEGGKKKSTKLVQPQHHAATLYFSKTRHSLRPAPVDLFMDPTTLTLDLAEFAPMRFALEYLQKYPKAQKKQLVNHLMSIKRPDGQPLCSRSYAYERAKELGLLGTNDDAS